MEFLTGNIGKAATRSHGPHVCSLLLLSLVVAPTLGQQLPELVKIPRTATALEGVPTVRVSSDENATEKRALDAGEAVKNRLLVTIVDGHFYWASRGNQQLEIHESGSFTYLWGVPGAYMKFTRVGNKIIYMEHTNIFLSTLTYWGEMRIITGR